MKEDMKNAYRKLPARFGPETRFELTLAPSAPFRAFVETQFEDLKNRLVNQRLEETWESPHNVGLRRAANEAAALAWVTPFPLLVFPMLFEEKADVAIVVAKRQAYVRRSTRELMAV